MQSRLIINLVLLAFIVGVSLYLSFTTTDEETRDPVTIGTIAAKDITTITIERPEKTTIRFERSGDQWMMQSPYTAKADPRRIEALLGILDMPAVDQLNADETELARLGLDDPQVTLHLNDRAFAFGDTNPLDKTRYILHDNTVSLINDNLFPQLTTSAVFFIDTKVVPDHSPIVRVQYPQFRLVRQEERWQLESELDISDEQIQNLGRLWKELRASGVQKYVAMEALYDIIVTLENGETIAYAVVSDLPSLILARPDLGLQYPIPAYLSEKLFPREEANGPGTE